MTEMDRPPLPADPRRRMGVYKSLAEVPPRYRLKFHADAYAGRDVWREFGDAMRDLGHDSETYRTKSERVERYWKAHMAERGRHHALAIPGDVETFVADLLDSREPVTVYSPYWVRLEAFYDWLQWHTDHPHRYHPVLMAAAEGTTAGRIWDTKLDRNRTR